MRCQGWLHKRNNVGIATVVLLFVILILIFVVMMMVKAATLTILVITKRMKMINNMEKSKT